MFPLRGDNGCYTTGRGGMHGSEFPSSHLVISHRQAKEALATIQRPRSNAAPINRITRPEEQTIIIVHRLNIVA
jgi:hypothetical protein